MQRTPYDWGLQVLKWPISWYHAHPFQIKPKYLQPKKFPHIWMSKSQDKKVTLVTSHILNISTYKSGCLQTQYFMNKVVEFGKYENW